MCSPIKAVSRIIVYGAGEGGGRDNTKIIKKNRLTFHGLRLVVSNQFFLPIYFPTNLLVAEIIF